MAIHIEADQRILVVFALFNSVYGYDTEYGERKSAARNVMIEHCNRYLATVNPAVVQSWRSFRRDHPLHIWAHLYFSLTRSPADFQLRVVPTEDIPIDITVVDELHGFDLVMSEFARIVNADELREKLLPEWNRAVEEYDRVKIERDVSRIHSFLKLAESEIPELDIGIVPAPFESHYCAFGAPFRSVFYTIDGPGTSRGGFNTHEYLHVFINRIPIESIPAEVRKSFDNDRGRPAVSEDYNDPKAYLYENTVRATHYAAGGIDPREIPYAIDADRAIGLSLVGPLYEEICQFPESHESSFSEFIRNAYAGLK
jgi:hypothetical protein